MGHGTTTINRTNGIDVLGDIAPIVGRSGEGNLHLLCLDKDASGNDVSKLVKWGWRKPVRHSSPGFDISSYSAGAPELNGEVPTGEFWIGALAMPYANSLGTVTPTTVNGSTTRVPAADTFFYKLMRGQLEWEYKKPRGVGQGPNGKNEWHREFDFTDYNNACVCPLPVAPSGVRNASTGSVTLLFNIPSTSAAGNMTLATMSIPTAMLNTGPALTEFYGGLLFYKSDYTDCFWQTSTAKLGTSSTENTNKKVSLTSLSDKLGLWKVRSFLSLNPLTFCENPSENLQIFIAGEEVERSIAFLTDSQYNTVAVISKSAKWIPDQLEPSKVHVQVTIINGTSYTVTLSSAKFNIEYLGPDEQNYDQYDDRVLAPGETTSYAHNFDNVLYGSGFCSCRFTAEAAYNHQTTTVDSGMFQATT